MDMTGRTVAITGGAGHVGRAAAEAYMELGANVVLLDRDAERMRATNDELGKLHRRFGEAIPVDLESATDRQAAVAATLDVHGRLDVLVNCAAFAGSEDLTGWNVPFEEQSIDTWRRAFEVNVTAAFHLTQLTAPHLRESPNGGAVVNVASIYGLVGPDLRLYTGTAMGNPAAYAASKGGLVQLTRWLCTVLAPSIRVNVIAPGGIERGQPNNFVNAYQERTPLQRLGQEQDLKGALAYLGSDLSAYVSGHTLVVDGGWTAW
jgi:NAD(P)-dependent dehydrogenase (short-subunit alcohol dehydrogenase family)